MENLEKITDKIPEDHYKSSVEILVQQHMMNGGLWYRPINSYLLRQLTAKVDDLVVSDIYMDRCTCDKNYKIRCHDKMIFFIFKN